ncbi:hypothetical protein DV735_g28, partial [Chaetothyriales sp. CBS 134920]
MPIEAPARVKQALFDPAVPALQVGGALGASGIAASAAAGQSGTLALAVGVQCFWLGTSTFYLRHALLVASQQPRTKRVELGCSAVAGTISGAISGVFNRNPSIIRPAILAGALSTGAQALFHSFRDAQHQPSADKSLVDRIVSYLPLKTLTDDEYERMLQEKLGKINVEIAILDDEIAALKGRVAGGQVGKAVRS